MKAFFLFLVFIIFQKSVNSQSCVKEIENDLTTTTKFELMSWLQPLVDSTELLIRAMLQSYPVNLDENAQTLDEPLQLLLASHAMSFGNEFTIVGYPDNQVMTIQMNLSDPEFTNTTDQFPLLNIADLTTAKPNGQTTTRKKYILDQDTGKVIGPAARASDSFNTTTRPWYYDSTTSGNFTSYLTATTGAINIGFSKSFFHDYTHEAQPPIILGVASTGKPISNVDKIMQTIVKNDPKALIYVFERITDWERNNTNSPPNNYIVATSDPNIQTFKLIKTNPNVYDRVRVLDVNSMLVRNSSKFILDNMINTDTTFIWTDSNKAMYTVSIQNLNFKGIMWAIVVVTEYDDDTSSNCITSYDQDVIEAVKFNVDNYLNVRTLIGKFMSRAYNYKVVENTNYAAPGIGNSNMQLFLSHIFQQYMNVGIARVYIGFEDNSFCSYGFARDDKGNDKYETYTFRDKDGAPDVLRKFYRATNGVVHTDPVNPIPFRNGTYIVTTRKWYEHAESYKVPYFPAVYPAASDGLLSISHAVPIYNLTGTFKGVFASDTTLDSLNNELNAYNEDGFVSYIMESKAINPLTGVENQEQYKLVATSNFAPVNDTEGNRISADVASSFYISKSASYLKTNEDFLPPLTTQVDSSIPALSFEMTRLKYSYSNLRWDIVTTEQLLLTSPASSSTASMSSKNDDELATETRDIAAATLAFVFFVFIGGCVVVYYFSKKSFPSSSPSGQSPMHNNDKL